MTAGPACWADAERIPETALAERRRARSSSTTPSTSSTPPGPPASRKCATLSHHNILNNGCFIGETLAYGPEDRGLHPGAVLPLASGWCSATWPAPPTEAAWSFPGEAFEPQAVLETVQAERCTSLYGVPTMFIAELDQPNRSSFDLSALRTGIMAGSPCPVEVMRKVQSQMNMARGPPSATA